MSVYEVISLIKNYEEQVKNYHLYINKINLILINNPAYVNDIKSQMTVDYLLKNRLIKLGNSFNGIVIQKLFSDLFEVENKKVR